MYSYLEIAGLGAITIVSFQIIRWISGLLYYHIVKPFIFSPSVNLKEQGKWALVTGSTDGIGLAYAEYLASIGMDVILISRSMEKLQATAANIEEKYKVQTKVIEADFSKTDIYKTIEKMLYGYEIGVLVNNVGLSYPHPELFLDLPLRDKVYSAIINCNIYSVTKMCMLVMPFMVERKKGVVINLSSTAAQIPSPMLTVYGATKSYIAKFSADLAAEYKKHGIVIQCLMPGYVATRMSKIRKDTWMAPSPANYVKNAVKYIGVQETSTGYYPHSLLLGVITFIENCSQTFARWIIIRMMENIRLRAIKRYVG